MGAGPLQLDVRASIQNRDVRCVGATVEWRRGVHLH